MLDEPKLCICPGIRMYGCWENWIYTSAHGSMCIFMLYIPTRPPRCMYCLLRIFNTYLAMYGAWWKWCHPLLRYAHQCFYLVSIVTFCETHTIFPDILLPWVLRRAGPPNVKQWKKQRNNITIDGTLFLPYTYIHTYTLYVSPSYV